MSFTPALRNNSRRHVRQQQLTHFKSIDLTK